jgi:hypothetical protein
MELPAAGRMFCIFCSQFQEELFDMQHQQHQSKKKMRRRKDTVQRM